MNCNVNTCLCAWVPINVVSNEPRLHVTKTSRNDNFPSDSYSMVNLMSVSIELIRSKKLVNACFQHNEAMS